VLDDNRVYRLTDAPPAPPPRPKKKKTARSGRRSSKRRRTNVGTEEHDDDNQEAVDKPTEPEDDGLGGMTWECLAVTLDEVRTLLDGFRKTRDDNEKILRKQLEDHLVPILEKQEESRKRKALQRERELLNLAKMANAKRSSRIASKMEQQKQEEKSREELQQQREAEAAMQREEQARLRREKERDFRLASREQRLKEREARRLRHEEELAQLSEDSKRQDDSAGRVSERRLQLEIERNQRALEELEDEDDDWIFDCICGLHGQIDDGTHSVACERCNIWQHSKCLGISEEEAERPEFHFVCRACRRRSERTKDHPRATIKLKINRSGGSNPEPDPDERRPGSEGTKTRLVVEIPSRAPDTSQSLQIPKPPKEETYQRSHPVSLGGLAAGPVLPAPEQSSPQQLSPSKTPKETKLDPSDRPNTTLAHGANEIRSYYRNPESLARNKEPSGDQTMGSTSRSLAETPSANLGQLQGRDSTHEPTLSTPAISRDIYRAVHIENGNLPAQAGISPIKQSPQSSFSSRNANGSNTTPAKIPPGITLSPTPQEPILTPPTKHPEPVRPQGPK
jgi:hypothetical protein